MKHENSQDCDGGWVRVMGVYAQGQANLTTEPGTRANDLLVAAHANTYYPCRVCEPGLFFRWHEGHFNAEHDRSACPDCQTVKGASRRRVAAVRGRAEGEPPIGEPPPDADEPRYVATPEEIAHQAALIENERADLQ